MPVRPGRVAAGTQKWWLREGGEEGLTGAGIEIWRTQALVGVADMIGVSVRLSLIFHCDVAGIPWNFRNGILGMEFEIFGSIF